MKKEDRIIANLTQCAAEAFGKSDLSQWLDSRLKPLAMSPRQYIAHEPDVAEEVLRIYLCSNILS